MAGRILRELLNGGVCTVRHPLMLRPGELQQAANCILRPADTSLHRSPGRAAYGTVKSTNYTTTVDGTATLTRDPSDTNGAWGLSIATVTVTLGSPIITKASGFGTVPDPAFPKLLDDSSMIKVGQSIYGTGIPAGTVVKRVIDLSNIEMSQAATSTPGGGTTVTFSDLHPTTRIVGDRIPVDTTVSVVTSATALTMSQAATTTNATPTARALSEPVSGLSVLTFDHGNKDLLIAKAADKLHYSQLTAITGTFTELSHGLSQNAEAIMASVQFQNKHAILTGYDDPRVINYTDLGAGKVVVERAMGMKPVADYAGVTVTAGTWSSLPDMGTGYYYFMVTEVAKFADGTELESTWAGKLDADPKKWVQITNVATEAVLISYSPVSNATDPIKPVNDGHYGTNTATHWRIYMSPKQESLTPLPDLAAFVRIREVPIATNFVILKDAAPYQSGYAKSLSADGANLALFPGGSTNALSAQAIQTKTCTLSGRTLTAEGGADFSAVAEGMSITSANNYIPYGTTVTAIDRAGGSTTLTMSQASTVSATGQTIYFGNSMTFDNKFATCPVNTDATRRGGIFQNWGISNVGNFSTITVTGIKVEIKGAFLSGGNDSGFTVEVSRDGTTFSSTGYVCQFKGGTVAQRINGAPIVLGGELDLWSIAGWVPADFIDDYAAPFTKFAVRLRKNYGGDGEEWTHLIDGIKVTVYGGTNTINLNGEPFRTVTISDQLGNTFGSPARGAPPVANTGDIFEGQLLLNDAKDESIICGSLPGEYEAFPDVYRIPIESRDNDKIRVIRRLNNTCVILCQNSVKRLNYFPKETDPEFNKGRCYEDITLDHGVVGPQAADLVEIQGLGTVLVYASHTGLRATDGVTTKILNDDLTWSSLFASGYIQRTLIIAYPKLWLIAMYYVPSGSTRRTAVIYFSYHPIHLKEGNRLPAMGPTGVDVGSGAAPLITGVPYLFTGHNVDGKVYVEDQGEDNTLEQTIKTRRYYAVDFGRSARIERQFLFTDANGTHVDTTFTGTGDFSYQFYRQNQGEALTSCETMGQSTATGGILELFGDNAGETFEATIFKSISGGQTASMRIHFIGFEITGAQVDTNN